MRPAPTTATEPGCSSSWTELRLGAVLAGVGDGQRVLGGLEVEGQPDDAVVERLVDDVAGVGEDPQHLPVGRQHVGDEPRDAALAGGGGDVLEEDRAEPPALVRVLDVERDLGLVRRRCARSAPPRSSRRRPSRSARPGRGGRRR